MFNIFLTQSGGLIIGNIAKLIGLLLNLIYEGLSSIGIVNLGLCIIILTLVVKLCMVPLTIKQQKFQKMNSIMQPEIAKINKKYKNKMSLNKIEKIVYDTEENNLDKLLDCGLRNVLKAARSEAQYQSMCVIRPV